MQHVVLEIAAVDIIIMTSVRNLVNERHVWVVETPVLKILFVNVFSM